MTGAEVHAVMTRKGVTHLHHANSVRTSASWLRLGGLASRAAVEAANLPQSAQYTDALDKRFGIWNDIFTDGVDIHDRAGTRNLYGPVLFRQPLDLLLQLPAGTDVMVTRSNPARWSGGETDADHYFLTPAELAAGYSYGDFSKHIVLRTARGIVPFMGNEAHVILDGPAFVWPDKRMVFDAASEHLAAAARHAGIRLTIDRRACRGGCRCSDAGHRPPGYTVPVVHVLFWG